MKDDNPYAPVSATVTADGADQPRPSLLRVVAMLSAAAVFGLFLLWSAGGVYFTLHPAALQSGNQVAPASFESSDYPMLVAWSTAAAAFAVALIWCAVGTVSALRRLLGQWRSSPGQPRGAKGAETVASVAPVLASPRARSLSDRHITPT